MAVCDTFTGGPVSVHNSGWSSLASRHALASGATSITCTFANNVAGGGPHGNIAVIGEWFNASGAGIAGIPETDVTSGSSVTRSFDVPSGATAFDLSATPGPADNSNTITAFVDVNCGSPTYCVYGTEVKPDTPQLVYLAPQLLTGIVGAVTDGWGWVVLALFTGSTLDVGHLCSLQPPAPVDITSTDIWNALKLPKDADSLAASAKLWAWLQGAAWNYFCRCTPGSPDPLPPPAPTPYSVTDAPLSPVLSCDTTELCTIVSAIQAQLIAMQGQLRSVQSDVTLVQRQHVPFAYVPGATHVVTGQGEVAVQGILGLSVTLTGLDPHESVTLGYPALYYGIGRLTLGTADGWLRAQRLTHASQLLLDIDAAVTRVGYTLADGVTATILELLREP